MTKDNIIQTTKIDTKNMVSRIYYLSSNCIMSNDNLIVKTEGNYVPAPHFIMWHIVAGIEICRGPKFLARELKLPPPLTGQYDIHYGVLVQDDNNILY
ncbi:hypothetical protein [Citrobacter freundii]|nr:hypothetical protein [Citrobacter freundii]